MSPLFENAVDSLQTGMQFFRDKRPKFAILLIFHSIELLLKELLSRNHPILIYRNIIRFENIGINLPKEQRETLKTLQGKRNRIEHHRYEPHISDADTLGQSLKFIMLFMELQLHAKLSQHIDAGLLDEIERIVLSYNERLDRANYDFEQWLVETYAGGLDSEEFPGTVDCPICSQTLLVLGEATIGNYCFFCRTKVDAVECIECGSTLIPQKEGDDVCDTCTAYMDN